MENEDRRERTLESKNEFVKIPIISLSRAYAYARINRSFIIFAVTSVTGLCVSRYDTVFYYMLMYIF